MPHQRRHRRKYRIKDEAFVRYVVSFIKSLPREELLRNLDDYERAAVVRPAQWARDAPLEEIMTVCAKFGNKMTLIALDERKPLKAFEISKATREFYRNKDLDALMEVAANHKFFSMGGSIIMKNLGLYSQVLNGKMYVPNKDYATFVAIGFQDEKIARQLTEAVDEVLGKSLVLKGIEDLTIDDLAVLYTVRKYDDTPLSGMAVYGILEYNRHREKIRRSLSKLVGAKYLCKYGVKNGSMYSLTEKGWGLLNKIRATVFENVKISSFEIRQEIVKLYAEQPNGTEKQPERKKAVA